MKIYIVKDDDPEGGYFSFGPEEPPIHEWDLTSVEVRVVEGGDLWERWNAGLLPHGIDGSLDALLVPLWIKGKTIWRRGES